MKKLLSVVIAAAIVLVVILTLNAAASDTDPIAFTWLLLKWVGAFASFLTFLLFAAWRWIPPLQRLIFPYLGGSWTGKIVFEGVDGEEERTVTLHVHHTPVTIKLILESEESLSKTLAVQASKSEDLGDSDKLYYVYLNTRKEGGKKSHRSYRGVAILRVNDSDSLMMVGDYFTDSHRRGRLQFDVVKLNPWWMLWK